MTATSPQIQCSWDIFKVEDRLTNSYGNWRSSAPKTTLYSIKTRNAPLFESEPHILALPACPQITSPSKRQGTPFNFQRMLQFARAFVAVDGLFLVVNFLRSTIFRWNLPSIFRVTKLYHEEWDARIFSWICLNSSNSSNFTIFITNCPPKGKHVVVGRVKENRGNLKISNILWKKE